MTPIPLNLSRDELRDAPATEPQASFTHLVERERQLRSMLLEARDALVRRELDLREVRAGIQGSARDASQPLAPVESPGYERLRQRVREAVRVALPPGARTLVVSRGDFRLLDLGPGVQAWHFPRDSGGGYAGHYPRDSAAAIEHLEALRSDGAEFLVLPATGFWWFDHYPGLARHLESRYRVVFRDPEICVVFALRDASADASTSAPQGVTPKVEPRIRRPLAAVTIISRNYLSQARVLAKSFLEHEPDSRFYMLVVDRLPEGVDVGAEVHLVEPEELTVPDFFEMCFKYGIVEFNTAVKPYLLSLLMRRYNEEEVVYFDPDIVITRPLDEIRDALQQGDIVLTPHILTPLPLDGLRPSDQDIMISGAYNLGFIALRRSQETEKFLQWWEERLRDGCRIDVPNGLFTDQRWIDLVPSLFPSAVILRADTYNVAFWNLHERAISQNGEQFLVNGRPATFFHLSGFSPEKPRSLSKHQTRTEVVEGSALEALLTRYAELLVENGYHETSRWEYGYERFDNGVRVHPLLRQIYLNLDTKERRRFGDPFSTKQDETFLDWATRPRPEEGNLSLFLQSIYRVRYDLPPTFPDVRGRDRTAFLKWARRFGSVEMRFEPELVRDGERIEASPGDEGVHRSGDTTRAERSPRIDPGARSSAMTYGALIERVKDVVRTTLPAGTRVLVVSKGDYRLLDLGGCEGWHFPQTEEGVYGGFHPSDDAVAIAHLEALRDKGADFLLIPQTAFWWLDHYVDFRSHVEHRYRLVVEWEDTCVIFSLREPPEPGTSPRMQR